MDEGQLAKPVLRPIGVKSNPLLAPFHTLTEIRRNRFLVRNLIRREVRGRYRNAALRLCVDGHRTCSPRLCLLVPLHHVER